VAKYEQHGRRRGDIATERPRWQCRRGRSFHQDSSASLLWMAV
jgi:hypothetical protein